MTGFFVAISWKLAGRVATVKTRMSERAGSRHLDFAQLVTGTNLAQQMRALPTKEGPVKLLRYMILALLPALALTVAGCGDTSNGTDMSIPVDMAQNPD
jgi:hypothetical protein